MTGLLPGGGSSGGEGGAVESVNGQDGEVVLTAADVGAVATGDIGTAAAEDVEAFDAAGTATIAVAVVSDALDDNGKGFVNHGSTAATARPSGFASVDWYGTVEPDNAVEGDQWIDPTA